MSVFFSREKEGDLTQSYDKTPYTNRKFENQRTTHTNATKNFDYTTIADRLRTDKQIAWTAKRFSDDLFVPRYDSFPMNPDKKALIPYIYILYNVSNNDPF